ncbi:nucleotide exchange factor GrpE [Nitrospirillum sp. BR 11164]|uniref:nucleotide exchange factor GrpE n=1 Tax=Nitrospirillum sp. BR 11164 TaxID=3104324 RepID=UPI002AFDF3C6|nr:nucleotide exchange factor GrpE [Nitrospirillum sp. BR 11164]MEA1649747.1 nucleotide exchange factor GrpE [Nitrospirillum sp. BR 11164]
MTDSNETTTAPETDAAPQQQAPASSDAVATLEAEVASLKDQLLRSMAEAENTRRRAQKEREDTAKYAVSGFAKELLAVADNLRRAIEAVPAETRAGNDQVNTLLTGVEATERQLIAAFDRAGIVKLEPMGQPFDPNFHQVVAEVNGTDKPAGTVVTILQPGYTIQGRLLREAMVCVAKAGPSSAKVDTSA